MFHARVVAVLLTFWLLPLLTAGDENPAYPNSQKGFKKQFEGVDKALKAGDEQRLRTALDQFAMPTAWFLETFGEENGKALADQYAQEFGSFQRKTVNGLRFFGAQAPTAVDVKEPHYKSKPNPPPAPPPAALKPLPEVRAFEIEYTLLRGTVMKFGIATSRTSWMDLFVYVDGAFRYFGSGAYPFWSSLRMYPSDPCFKPGNPKGGEVLERVEPTYPDTARANHVEGTVTAFVLIGKDGSAKEVTVKKGDPALGEAAKEAILQWKFRPFMNCGQPAEGRTLQKVEFSLPK